MITDEESDTATPSGRVPAPERSPNESRPVPSPATALVPPDVLKVTVESLEEELNAIRQAITAGGDPRAAILELLGRVLACKDGLERHAKAGSSHPELIERLLVVQANALVLLREYCNLSVKVLVTLLHRTERSYHRWTGLASGLRRSSAPKDEAGFFQRSLLPALHLAVFQTPDARAKNVTVAIPPFYEFLFPLWRAITNTDPDPRLQRVRFIVTPDSSSRIRTGLGSGEYDLAFHAEQLTREAVEGGPGAGRLVMVRELMRYSHYYLLCKRSLLEDLAQRFIDTDQGELFRRKLDPLGDALSPEEDREVLREAFRIAWVAVEEGSDLHWVAQRLHEEIFRGDPDSPDLRPEFHPGLGVAFREWKHAIGRPDRELLFVASLRQYVCLQKKQYFEPSHSSPAAVLIDAETPPIRLPSQALGVVRFVDEGDLDALRAVDPLEEAWLAGVAELRDLVDKLHHPTRRVKALETIAKIHERLAATLGTQVWIPYPKELPDLLGKLVSILPAPVPAGPSSSPGAPA